MKDRVRTLDFSRLPSIGAMDIIIRLDFDVHTVLTEASCLSEVHERSQAALMFICGVAKENEAWRNSALLRAGLNEFYSIEDAATRDFKKHLPSLTPPAIGESPNPLVHLMYILRHVNVHAHLSRTRVHQTTVTHTHEGETQELPWNSVVLDAPTLEQLQRCSEARKHYVPDELARAAAWLDDVQHTFGVGEVFRRGLSSYCREVIVAAGLAKPNKAMQATCEDARA